jgi:hypothetical protein
MSSSSYRLWEIDDGNLSYYYVAESTQYGVYYRLKEPAAGFPEGFYESERWVECSAISDEENWLRIFRDQEMADYNQQLGMAQSSGDQAKEARGKRVDDDTTLPSERIKNAAEEASGQVLSSGSMAKEKRKKNKKKWEKGNWVVTGQ